MIWSIDQGHNVSDVEAIMVQVYNAAEAVPGASQDFKQRAALHAALCFGRAAVSSSPQQGLAEGVAVCGRWQPSQRPNYAPAAGCQVRCSPLQELSSLSTSNLLIILVPCSLLL